MASANKRSCHRVISFAMFPVTEQSPNTPRNAGLPAVVRISAEQIICRPASFVKSLRNIAVLRINDTAVQPGGYALKQEERPERIQLDFSVAREGGLWYAEKPEAKKEEPMPIPEKREYLSGRRQGTVRDH